MNIGKNILIEIGKSFTDEFVIENEDILNYQILFYYFAKNKIECDKHNINLDKGIWIFGEVGSGKSLALKIFQEFCAYTPHLGNRRFSIHWFTKIKKEYEDNEKRKFISEKYGYDALKDICYDEFLRKHNVKNYGENENLAEMLIDERYERFINDNYKTHITTNVAPSYVKDNSILDVRTLDRCVEMFNIIEWKGKSKRI